MSEEDIAGLLEGCVAGILALLRKSGYLDDEGVFISQPLFDRVFAESEAITQASVASIRGCIAFGPNAPNLVQGRRPFLEALLLRPEYWSEVLAGVSGL